MSSFILNFLKYYIIFSILVKNLFFSNWKIKQFIIDMEYKLNKSIDLSAKCNRKATISLNRSSMFLNRKDVESIVKMPPLIKISPRRFIKWVLL